MVRSPYSPKKTELVGMKAVQDTIELALWTPYVKDERIVSLLLIGEPESGKTELMKKYRKNNGVYPRRRFSAYGITQDLIKGKIPILFKNPLCVGHILTYDYANNQTYKQSSTDSTIEFLSAFTEDGLEKESSYWIKGDELKPFEGLTGGLIAGINTFGFFTKARKVKANFYKGGWFSRNIVVSIGISEVMLSKIFDSIVKGKYRKGYNFVNFIPLGFPKKRKDVWLSKSRAEAIRVLAREVADEYTDNLKPYRLKGIRLHKSLISLVKASALREGRKYVSDDDLERIKYLSYWMNLKMRKLKVNYPWD